MRVTQLPTKALKGLSFGVAELLLVSSWSEANGLRMVVRLDHGSDAEEYEEVLAFHLADSRPCNWIMWRDANFRPASDWTDPTLRIRSRSI
jgi:hypothetical protein